MGNPKAEVDHINGNGLDNRRCNLRLVTSRQNKRNQRGRGLSNYIGVTMDKSRKKWLAQIKHYGKRFYIGRYVCEKEAAAMRDRIAYHLWGEDAKLNVLSTCQSTLTNDIPEGLRRRLLEAF